MLPRKKGYQMTFQFASTAKGLPNNKKDLRTFAFYAYAQHMSEGKKVKVGRPAFAVGCEMRPSVMQAIRAEGRK